MVPQREWDSYPWALWREEGNLHRILNQTEPARFFIQRKETTCYQRTAPFWSDSWPKLNCICNCASDMQLGFWCPAISSARARLLSNAGWVEHCCSWGAGKDPSGQICNRQVGKRSGMERSQKRKLEGEMVTARSSWELTVLPRAIKNKSKPGHSAARPPQVIIAVRSIWKINTQNTRKPRLQHCMLLNNSPRWKVINLKYAWLPYNIVQERWAA